MTQNPQKNLKLLLCHDEEVNIQIGLQILSNLPEKRQYATYIFALAYYHDSKTVREPTKKMFSQLSKGKLVPHTYNFRNKIIAWKEAYTDDSPRIEDEVTQVLQELADYEILNLEELANLTLYFTGMGLHFCVEHKVSIWDKSLTNITHLDLSGIYDETNAQYLTHLSSITSLDLSNNQLEYLPSEVLNLSSLQKLNISKNRLKALPEEIDRLTQLEALDAAENFLETLPDGLCDLTNLWHLNLEQNLLKTLPERIGYYSPLSSVNLCHNFLTDLPLFFNCPYSDSDIKLYYNKISPTTWEASCEHRTLYYHFWIEDEAWIYLNAQSSFFIGEEEYNHLLPLKDWNTRQASQIGFAENVLESYEAFNQSEELRFILEDNLLNTDEKAAYWQEMFALTDKENPMSDDEYLRQGFWPEKTEQTPENLVAMATQYYLQQENLHDRFTEFYPEEGMADFLQEQTQLSPEVWACVYETGLRVSYFTEGESSVICW